MKKIMRLTVIAAVIALVGCRSTKVDDTPIKVPDPIPKIESEKEVTPTSEKVPEKKPEKPEEPVKKPVAKKETKKIYIVGTADVHGRVYPYKYKEFDRPDIGGLARISTFIKDVRAKHKNVLVIDMGDTVFFEPFVKIDPPSMMGAYNYLKYDMISLGNHELYMTSKHLRDEINKFNGKVISNNVYLEGNDHLFTNESAIFDVDGIKIAITGSSIQQKGIRKELLSYEYNITDPLEATKRAVKNLDGKYDILIGAFHLNKYGQDGSHGSYEVMEEVPEFLFAFSGHEHVDNGYWYVDGKHLLANNAYGITAILVEVDLEKVDGKWVATKVNPVITPLSTIEPDKIFMDRFRYLHEETIEYVGKGIPGWEKAYHQLHKYIIP